MNNEKCQNAEIVSLSVHFLGSFAFNQNDKSDEFLTSEPSDNSSLSVPRVSNIVMDYGDFCSGSELKESELFELNLVPMDYFQNHFSNKVDNDVREVQLIEYSSGKVNECLFNASYSSNASLSNCEDFVLDSACTDHVLNNNRGMMNVHSVDIPISVTKKWETIIVVKSGDLTLKSELNKFLKLENLLFVPQIRRNLLSMPKMMMAGLRIKAEGTTVKVTDPKTGTLIVIGKLVSNLIFMKFVRVTDDNDVYITMITISENEKIKMWHDRLGHQSVQYLNKLKESSTGIDDIDFQKLEICHDCIEAKMVRDPYARIRRRATRVLEIIWGDLLEITPSKNDIFTTIWVFSIIDDFSRYVVSYTIKSKTDVLSCFKLYVAAAEAMYSKRVSQF